MIPQSRIEEIKKLCDVATDGPWTHGYPDGSGMYNPQSRFDDSNFAIVSKSIDPDQSAQAILHGQLFSGKTVDADFIAASREIVPELLSAVQALTEENERLKRELVKRIPNKDYQLILDQLKSEKEG